MRDKMREVRFAPYYKGHGPRFTLRTYYIGTDHIGYKLTMREKGKTTVLFKGQDFRPSPLHAIDSDEAVKALMSFLTLRLGDTDAEYFRNYTPIQLEYCEQHAESLSVAVYDRWGE